MVTMQGWQLALSIRPLVRWVSRRRRAALVGVALSGLALSAVQVVRLGGVYVLVSTLLGSSGGEATGVPGGLSGRVDRVLDLLPIGDRLTAAVVLFVGVEVTYFLLRYANDVLVAYTSLKLRRDFNVEMFEKYAEADYGFVLARRHGDLLYRVLSAPVWLGQLLVGLPRLLVEGLTFIAILGWLALFSIHVALLVAVIAAVSMAIFGKLGGRWTYDWGAVKVRVRARQEALVNEALDGIKQLKVCGHLKRWGEEFRGACNELAVMQQKLFATHALPKMMSGVGSAALVAGVAIVLKVSLGERFHTYLPLLGMYLVALRRVLGAAAAVTEACLKVVENVPLAELLHEELRAPSRAVADGHRSPPSSLGTGVLVDGVSFSYGDRQVLSDVSLLCARGQVTAVVGPSGAGKSTLLNLIVRLYDPTAGAVRVGDVDLSALEMSAWRRRIGFVPQESHLMNATVAENITLGRDASQERIRWAARLADADSFIEQLPQGYDTVVGEGGLKLSGGQRQRIGIARAVLEDPEILLFDEATSSLDARSEEAVQAAIRRVSGGRTVVIVAHRLSTVQQADQIVVLAEGRVVERGTHAALMEARGPYRSLYERTATSELRDASSVAG